VKKTYALGTRPITEPQLAAIPSSNVTDVNIGGLTYKKAWFGSSVMIVKPSEVKVRSPKTGIEKLQLHPDLHLRLSKGSDLPPKVLSTIPGKT
jgi:hypothetical protein